MKAGSKASLLVACLVSTLLDGCVLAIKEHDVCPSCAAERERIARESAEKPQAINKGFVDHVRWLDRGLLGHKLMHERLHELFCADQADDDIHYGTISALVGSVYFNGATNVLVDLRIDDWDTLITMTGVTIEYGSRNLRDGGPKPLPGSGTPITGVPPPPAPGATTWEATNLPAIYDESKETFWVLVTVTDEPLIPHYYFEEYFTPRARPLQPIPVR